jgi:Concanavalin A-like lectin/glucanases superfamily
MRHFCALIFLICLSVSGQPMLLNSPDTLAVEILALAPIVPEHMDATNLLYWFPLDNATSLYDATGNSLAGVFSGIPAPNAVVGQITNAVVFDDNAMLGNSSIGTTTITSLNLSAGTITWWQKPTLAYNFGAQLYIWAQQKTGDSQELSAQIYTGLFQVGWYGSPDARVSISASPANWVTTNWNFYSVTWSSLGTGLLMNGVQIGTNTDAPAVANFGNALVFGNNLANQTLAFYGGIDDFRVYSGVKSTAALTYTYQRGLLGEP